MRSNFLVHSDQWFAHSSAKRSLVRSKHWLVYSRLLLAICSSFRAVDIAPRRLAAFPFRWQAFSRTSRSLAFGLWAAVNVEQMKCSESSVKPLRFPMNATRSKSLVLKSDSSSDDPGRMALPPHTACTHTQSRHDTQHPPAATNTSQTYSGIRRRVRFACHDTVDRDITTTCEYIVCSSSARMRRRDT